MLSNKGLKSLRDVAESSARVQEDEELEADAETVERVSKRVRSEDARTAFATLAEIYRAEIARRSARRVQKRKAAG